MRSFFFSKKLHKRRRILHKQKYRWKMWDDFMQIFFLTFYLGKNITKCSKKGKPNVIETTITYESTTIKIEKWRWYQRAIIIVHLDRIKTMAKFSKYMWGEANKLDITIVMTGKIRLLIIEKDQDILRMGRLYYRLPMRIPTLFWMWIGMLRHEVNNFCLEILKI